ncbi:MAG: peptide chain release factor N(5)-glutamine methyltransferase [Bacteroidota bacterium]|nr:peptide chain release factor N(5)-glutamine methyltransferase [Bacteroidota bacterium]
MSIVEAYNDFLKQLKSIYDDREADNIADWVFENVTQLKRWERRGNLKSITPEQELKLNKYLRELVLHKPVQYVLNEAWFYKLKFFVNEHVLIPRPETEELVSWMINDVRSVMYDVRCEEPQILDIGTGSGCIAISLKKELKDAIVTSIDISEQALYVAGKNAGDLHAEIELKQIDFLDENEWKQLSKYDIIVSNPPYIPKSEKEHLSTNVTAFEPGLALFADDNDPAIFYKKIAKFSQSHLKKQGNIYVEVHEEKAEEVKKIFVENRFTIEIRKDIYGKERMIGATR